MAASICGFYLALCSALGVIRAGVLDVGGHINDSCGYRVDFVFAVSNVLLAVLFGAALVNVIRACP